VVIASVVFFVAGVAAQHAVSRTLTVGARVGSVLQLHEAIHTLSHLVALASVYRSRRSADIWRLPASGVIRGGC